MYLPERLSDGGKSFLGDLSLIRIQDYGRDSPFKLSFELQDTMHKPGGTADLPGGITAPRSPRVAHI